MASEQYMEERHRTFFGLAEVEAHATATNNFYRNGVSHRICVTWGDTHVEPFNGSPFYNIYNNNGPFIAVRYHNKDPKKRFEVHVQQVFAGWGRARPVDNGFVILCGLDTVSLVNPRVWGQDITIKVNGQDISKRVDTTPRNFFPRAPKINRGSHPAYAIWKSGNVRGWRLAHVDCDHNGGPANGNNPYAAGFLVSMSWGNRPDTQWIYGNIKVLSPHTWYNGKLSGACGGGGTHPHTQNNVISWTDSMFNHESKAKEWAKLAKESKQVLDPDGVKTKEPGCIRSINKAAGVDVATLPKAFARVDKDVITAIQSYIRTCAIDSYFGFQYTADDMKDQICDWVGLAKDELKLDIEDMIKEIKACRGRVAQLTPMLYEEFELNRMCNANPPKRPASPPDGLKTCAHLVIGRAPRCDYERDRRGPWDVECLQNLWTGLGCSVSASKYPNDEYSGEWMRMTWGQVRTHMKSIRDGELKQNVERGTCYGDDPCREYSAKSTGPFRLECLQHIFVTSGCNRIGLDYPEEGYDGPWQKGSFEDVKKAIQTDAALARAGKRPKWNCDGSDGLEEQIE